MLHCCTVRGTREREEREDGNRTEEGRKERNTYLIDRIFRVCEARRLFGREWMKAQVEEGTRGELGEEPMPMMSRDETKR